MKTYNHLFHTIKQFNHYLAGIELNLDEPVLVRIHSCIHSCKAMEKLAGQIKSILPNACITGCSTTGVICEGKSYRMHALFPYLCLNSAGWNP